MKVVTKEILIVEISISCKQSNPTMVFYSVILGIHSKKLDSAFWILKLIGKDVWVIDEEGRKMKWDEKLYYNIDDWEGIDLEIQLYDDLVNENTDPWNQTC